MPQIGWFCTAAVFRVKSLTAAAQLAEAVAHVAELEQAGALMTIADDALTVRLTRARWQLERRHIDGAHHISAVARAHGAVSDRARTQDVQLAVAAWPDTVDQRFWRVVLGYDAVSESKLIDPLDHGSMVWMQHLNPTKPLRHAMHVDVSVAREAIADRLAAALAAGGRIVDDSHAPEWWTLADRAGNRVDITAWPDGYPSPVLAGSES